MPFDFSPVLSPRRFLPGRSTLQLDDAEGTVIAVDRGGRTIIAAEEDSRFGLLAPADCPEGVRAWMARKLAAVLGRRAAARSFGFVPYY